MKFNKNDAPLLIVMGQSNAHAHSTKLSQVEIDRSPLKNVYGLSREHNQSLDLKDIVWDNYTTYGMNLGETQDNTCSMATYFSFMWQNAIDKGIDIPNLYVIQISVGSQGIAENEVNNWNMWYPLRKPIVKSGVLYECDISLYPLAINILSHAIKNLKREGKNPVVIGLHWNQWECEAHTHTRTFEEDLLNYISLFSGFFSALNSDVKGVGIPVYLYKPISVNYVAERREILSSVFEKLKNTYSDCKILDACNSPFYNNNPNCYGIFLDDSIHYKPDVHQWFAEQQWDDIFKEII